MEDKKPTGKPILKMKGYEMYKNGELWKAGKYGYRAGYVWNKDQNGMEIAIMRHEEEMQVMLAEFQ